MRTAVLFLFLTAGSASSQPPTPPQSIDSIAGKITDIDKQVTDLAKQRAALVTDLRNELKRIADIVEKLNLDGPKPPIPVPPTPPADALKVKLKTAYDAETASTKQADALLLAALYRQAATLAGDATVTTSGELLGRVKEAAKTLVGADALKGVRAVAGAELGALLPTDAPLTADQRAATATLFLKLATALEEVAGK